MGFASALPETPLLLDTCILTGWRYSKPAIHRQIDDYIFRHEGLAPALASITVFEVLHGFEKEFLKPGRSSEQDNTDLRRTKDFIEQSAAVLPFDEVAAGIAAYVFPRLTNSERSKNWSDVLIAATALAHGYGVATADRKDFELIGRHLSDDHPLLYLAIWKAN